MLCSFLSHCFSSKFEFLCCQTTECIDFLKFHILFRDYLYSLTEVARDAFHENADYEVVGGIISPVHDSYRKPDLVTGVHRCAMVKISLQSSDWIRLSDWECNEQTEWTRTRFSLQYHQVGRIHTPLAIPGFEFALIYAFMSLFVSFVYQIELHQFPFK